MAEPFFTACDKFFQPRHIEHMFVLRQSHGHSVFDMSWQVHLLSGSQIPAVGGMVQSFLTELLQQVSSLLCHVQGGAGMVENWTIVKKNRTFLLVACCEVFSVVDYLSALLSVFQEVFSVVQYLSALPSVFQEVFTVVQYLLALLSVFQEVHWQHIWVPENGGHHFGSSWCHFKLLVPGWAGMF